MAHDVVVIGGGNAALCAALAAREGGASVLVLEKAPEAERGGNSFFTAGGFRFAHQGLEDLRRDVIPDLSDEEARTITIPAYTEDQYYDDIMRVTEGRSDLDLAQHLVQRSKPTMMWMRTQGIRWILMFSRQSYKVGDRHHFWGGLNLEAVGGGPGLVEALFERATKVGIEVRYGVAGHKLIQDGSGRVIGVATRSAAGASEIPCRAVVIASGGFEANPEWRTRYLGPNWDLARVRGTRHNVGEGIAMALEIGAQAYGHWSSCHAVAWDLNAPAFGDRRVGDMFQKHSYPLGLIVNVKGERFVDEGADFRNYTYAKYGREILRQPQEAAFQIFDQKTVELLREEYRIREITKAEAGTIEELAKKLEVNPEGPRPHRARLQRGGHGPGAVQPGRARRPRHPRDHPAQVQLGAAPRHPALRGLRRDLRHHLHLRRPARGYARPGARHVGPAHPGALRGGRAGGRPLLPQLPRRHRPDVGRRLRQDRRRLRRRRPSRGQVLNYDISGARGHVSRGQMS